MKEINLSKKEILMLHLVILPQERSLISSVRITKMTVRLIKGTFYVTSSKKDKVYHVTKDLACECKGYARHKHCYHQKQVLEHIEAGKTVDLARASFVEDQTLKPKGERFVGRVFIDQKKEWNQEGTI